jgi:hypothetical protein
MLRAVPRAWGCVHGRSQPEVTNARIRPISSAKDRYDVSMPVHGLAYVVLVTGESLRSSVTYRVNVASARLMTRTRFHSCRPHVLTHALRSERSDQAGATQRRCTLIDSAGVHVSIHIERLSSQYYWCTPSSGDKSLPSMLHDRVRSFATSQISLSRHGYGAAALRWAGSMPFKAGAGSCLHTCRRPDSALRAALTAPARRPPRLPRASKPGHRHSRQAPI